MATALMVWIDQDLCSGRRDLRRDLRRRVHRPVTTASGSSRRRPSTSAATIVFDAKDGAGHGPDGGRGVARIPDVLLDSAVEAAEECPGECIMIEPTSEAVIDSRGV